MIEIKNKVTGNTVEYICNEEDFRIDKDKIYSKDEFGNEVYFMRNAFFAEKKINLKPQATLTKEER